HMEEADLVVHRELAQRLPQPGAGQAVVGTRGRALQRVLHELEHGGRPPPGGGGGGGGRRLIGRHGKVGDGGRVRREVEARLRIPEVFLDREVGDVVLVDEHEDDVGRVLPALVAGEEVILVGGGDTV